MLTKYKKFIFIFIALLMSISMVAFILIKYASNRPLPDCRLGSNDMVINEPCNNKGFYP